MNLSDILSTQGGEALSQLARNFGIDENDARRAVGQLAPALTSALKQNASSEGGLASLLGALSNGNHGRYVDDPSTLANPESIDEGNRILGHVLGSKEASRDVAARAATDTGMDEGLLKQMLPMVAALTMGAASKQTSAAGENNILGTLTSFLDADKDGSVTDDLLNMAKKLF